MTPAPLPPPESTPEAETDPLLPAPDQAPPHWMAPAVEEEVERESVPAPPVPARRVAPSAAPRRVLDYHAAFRSQKQFGSLDGLRALSILGVVWHHAARSHALFFAHAGAQGVPLFFAISGFLITTLLLRERERTGTISLPSFYARRSLRIFPLYYAVLLAYAALTFVREGASADGREFFHNLGAFASYTSNWFVPLEGRVIFYFAWSLATEEQFYLVWPSLERFLGARSRHLPAAVALAVVALWGLVAYDVVALTGFARTVLLSVAPAICLGVALAHALHERTSFDFLARLLGRRRVATGLLVAVVAALLLDAPSLLAHALMVLLVGACVLREDHALARFLKLAPLTSIGQASYGIYLLHMLVLNLTEVTLRAAGLESPLLVFPLAVLGAWGLAVLSLRHFEGRFLRLKARFAR